MAESIENFLLEADQLRQEREKLTTDPAELTTKDAPVEGQYIPKSDDVDYSEDIRQTYDDRVLADSMRTVDELRKEEEVKEPTPTEASDGLPEPGFFTNLPEAAYGLAVRGFVGGTLSGTQKMQTSVEEMNEAFNQLPMTEFSQQEFLKIMQEKSLEVPETALPKTGIDVPQIEEQPKTVPEGLVKGISEFLPAFGLQLGIVRTAFGGATTFLGNLGQGEVAAALASLFVIDPYEKRLANMIEEDTEFGNALTSYLAADPDDSDAEAQFKSLAEGLLIGGGLVVAGPAIAKAFTSGVKFVKSVREARGIAPASKLNTPDTSIAKTIGTPDEPPVTVQKASASKKQFTMRTVQDVVEGDDFDFRFEDEKGNTVFTVVGEILNGEAVDVTIIRERGVDQLTVSQFRTIKKQLEEVTGPIDLKKSQDVRKAFAELEAEELSRQGLEEVPVERLIKAAVRVRGKTFVGENHAEALEKASKFFDDPTIMFKLRDEADSQNFGFLTSNNRVVNRTAALTIGKKANQIRDLSGQLSSEDVDFSKTSSISDVPLTGGPFVIKFRGKTFVGGSAKEASNVFAIWKTGRNLGDIDNELQFGINKNNKFVEDRKSFTDNDKQGASYKQV